MGVLAVDWLNGQRPSTYIFVAPSLGVSGGKQSNGVLKCMYCTVTTTVRPKNLQECVIL